MKRPNAEKAFFFVETGIMRDRGMILILYLKIWLEPSRDQEAYMGSSPVLDKSKSWFICPSTRLVSQGRTGLDGL